MILRSYVPSGESNSSAPILGLAIGGIFAIGCAIFYQWLVNLIPIIYLNFLISIGFGCLIGAVAAFGLRLGHCRSKSVATWVALVCGFVGVLASYPAAKHFYSADLVSDFDGSEEERRDFESNLDEIGTLEFMQIFAEEIGWGISFGRGNDNDAGSAMTGGAIYFFWFVELALIVGGATVVGRGGVTRPYCEASGDWCTREKLGTVKNVDEIATLTAAQQGDILSILNPIPVPKSKASITYTAYTSPSGRGPSYLTVALSYMKNSKVENEDLLAMVEFDTGVIDALRRSLQSGELLDIPEELLFPQDQAPNAQNPPEL